jgi:hypothetical protein
MWLAGGIVNDTIFREFHHFLLNYFGVLASEIGGWLVPGLTGPTNTARERPRGVQVLQCVESTVQTSYCIIQLRFIRLPTS